MKDLSCSILDLLCATHSFTQQMLMKPYNVAGTGLVLAMEWWMKLTRPYPLGFTT